MDVPTVLNFFRSWWICNAISCACESAANQILLFFYQDPIPVFLPHHQLSEKSLLFPPCVSEYVSIFKNHGSLCFIHLLTLQPLALKLYTPKWQDAALYCLTLAQQIITDFPGGSDSKASAYNAGDPGSIPRLGRSPGKWNGNPLHYSCLENPMHRGTW